MPLRDGSRGSFNGDTYVTGTVPLKIYVGNSTTSAAGAVTFAIPAGYFTTIYAADVTAVRNTADPTLACFALVRSMTLTTVVAQVFESKTTGVLIGGTIEGLEATSTATAVHVTVFGI